MAALDSGKYSIEEVAELFGVGTRSLYRWRALRKERGTLSPLPHKSGNLPRVDAQGAQVVRQILDEEPDLTIPQTMVYFIERTDRSCSVSAMGRAIRKLGLTRKKSR